ncbi:MAG: hypothetical protein ACOC3W_08055 [Thermodesulfobacteriota bacterium]
MVKNLRGVTGPKTARFCIWTILHQDRISFHFILYMYAVAAVIVVLHLFGILSKPVALGGLGIGGTSAVLLMWGLIRARKKAVLAIDDPKLREAAHEAMMIYLSRKPVSEKQKRELMNPAGPRDCRYEECP